MFQRILVPLDGSTRAEQSLSIAAQFVRESEGTIILLRVIKLATEYWPAISSPYGIPEAVIEDEQQQAEEYLHTVAARPILAGIHTECVAIFGAVAPTILDVATKSRADLIVICSHGYTGMTRVIMGSEADKVAHHSTIPTLIFHEHENVHKGMEEEEIGHMARPLRVLVPLDGSTHAEGALEYAATLLMQYHALGRKSALHLLSVISGPVGRFKGEGEKNRQEEQDEIRLAKEYLQAVVRKLQAGALAAELAKSASAITWSVTTGKDTAETIVQVAEGRDDSVGGGASEYIVLATHGRGAIQRWAMGSVTERVLHLSKQPVLVVRPSTSAYLANQPQPYQTPHPAQ